MNKKRHGFTLIEIIIVVVILGVLAAILAPRLVGSHEQVISGEGRQTLLSLVGAQKRYYLENSVYTTTIANLDTSIPASQYFNAAVALNPGASGNVGSVTRTTNTYTLLVGDTGTIFCSNIVAGSCASIHCTKGGGANQCN